MTEITESVALETWSVPSCPFTIEYSRRLLDDIRLAVVDAFFSLPRGGAEIGGVLLGKFANGRVTILEYVPLECEHIFGPSFTLSPGDHGRLAEIVSGSANQFNDLAPVGWYHSHTRSDIFLSEADLDIHNRYFREPWQVALVMRPSTFQPVQAGFFFREPDGSIHIRGSYQEFALDPLPVGQVPRGVPAPSQQPAQRPAEPEGPTITLTAAPVMPTVEAAPASYVAAAVAAPVEAPPPPQPAAAASFTPAAEPAPPPRATSLPPALPPLPRLELVPEPVPTPPAPVAEPVAELRSEPVAQHYPMPHAVPITPGPYQPYRPAPETPVAAQFAPIPGWAEAPAPVAEPEPPAAMPEFTAAETYTEPQAAEPQPPAVPPPAVEPPAPEIRSAPQPEPAALPEPAAASTAAEPPSFLQMEPVRSRRKLWVVGTAAAVVLLAAGGYQERGNWLTQVKGMFTQGSSTTTAPAPAPAPVALTLPLSATDQQGQLQLHWDGASRAVAQARDGILQITDDGATTDLPLDAAYLQGGGFTYARHGEHVDARLTVQELDGTQIRSVTSFFGAMPEPVKPGGAAEAALRRQTTELAAKNADLTRINAELQQRFDEASKQAARLKSDLAARTASATKQESDLTRLSNELRQQRDDQLKQIAKLKSELARAGSSKVVAPAPLPGPGPNSQLIQQRDDLLIEIAKLKTDLASRASGGQPASNVQMNADFSKQRYQLISRVSQLESDLAVATSRAERLARQLEDLRKSQTQRRLQNQSGDAPQ